MTTLSLVIFLLTYAGIAVGRYPKLALDRTGIALLGAILMVVTEVIGTSEALSAVHTPTLLLLYGLMIISAQLRLGGFYTWLAQRVTQWADNPVRFLFILMTVSGVLASVLANDIICLAFTPVLTIALRKRNTNPIPFLLGLAMSTNLGSATTIIGNPQSMLIGQVGSLSFGDFFLWCAPPSLIGLFATYGILLLLYRNRFTLQPVADAPVFVEPVLPSFNRRQTAKGLFATAVVIVLLLTSLPREWSVLAVAGALLISRKMHTRDMLGLVDWHLITLFAGLFIVVKGFTLSGLPEDALAALGKMGVNYASPNVLAVVGVLLSNVVSNVPATMLIIPHMPTGEPHLWYVLSLATTYAGNLLTIGSMANLIVIEQARLNGVRITFIEYLKTGVIVTAVNLALLLVWIMMSYPS